MINFACDYKVLSHSTVDKLGQKLSSYFNVNMSNFFHRHKVFVWKRTSEGSVNSVKFHFLYSLFIVVL